MKFHIITFGCQMNKSDSERIASLFENLNWNQASNIKEADLIIVNMCSVRQSAVDRVYGLIPKFKKLKKDNPNLKTVLTGCITASDRKKFTDKFDFVLDKERLPRWPKILGLNSNISKGNYLDIIPHRNNPYSALIPVSKGCDNYCSYCVVPYTRGSLGCREYEQILAEVRTAIDNDYKEIWLLGQNVNDYENETKDGTKIKFADLLKATAEINGDFWIRFTSPHPKNFSERIINYMAEFSKITPYLNLPLQSGDNEILKKMNRSYTIEEYKEIVKKIRNKIPNIALSTDIIVGFPGETKQQFKNTVKALKEIKFDMAYIAKYSPRPQTAASELEDNVSLKEKKRREKELTEILKKNALEFNKKFKGKELKTLVSEKKNDFLMGKTKHYKTVKFKGPKSLIGTFTEVEIKSASPWGLKGAGK